MPLALRNAKVLRIDRFLWSLVALVVLLLTLAGCGGGGSSAADPVSPPTIMTAPASLSVAPGTAANFSVEAAGGGLAYQWQRSLNGGLSWSDIAGASASSYSIAAVDATMNGQQFHVVVQNAAGIVVSAAAVLTVSSAASAPVFTQQPADQASTPPDAATFHVVVSGAPAPSLQWQVSVDGGLNWVALAGATGTTYITSSNFNGSGRAMNNARKYRAVASNGLGSATSQTATWSVRSAALGGLPTALHLSTSGELIALLAPNYAEVVVTNFDNRGAALLQRVSAAGAVSALAGSGSEGLVDGAGATARFNVGAGISFNSFASSGIGRDTFGNVYVADRENNVIRKVAADGTVSTFAGNGLRGTDDGPLATARFDAPLALAVASDGTVYVADSTRLRKISAGSVTTVAVLGGNTGLAMDAADTLYVLNAASIGRITAGGVSSQVGGLSGLSFSEDASVNSRLAGLTVDASGTMFATDAGLCLVRKITPSGVVSTLAGGPLLATDRCGYADGTGRSAKFGNDLRGIAMDAAGTLYVADGENLAIRKVTPTGLTSTFVR